MIGFGSEEWESRDFLRGPLPLVRNLSCCYMQIHRRMKAECIIKAAGTSFFITAELSGSVMCLDERWRVTMTRIVLCSFAIPRSTPFSTRDGMCKMIGRHPRHQARHLVLKDAKTTVWDCTQCGPGCRWLKIWRRKWRC